jgi:hypothetical protein
VPQSLARNRSGNHRTQDRQTAAGLLGAGPHPLANRCGQDQALALGAAVGLPAVSVKRVLDRVPASMAATD